MQPIGRPGPPSGASTVRSSPRARSRSWCCCSLATHCSRSPVDDAASAALVGDTTPTLLLLLLLLLPLMIHASVNFLYLIVSRLYVYVTCSVGAPVLAS